MSNANAAAFAAWDQFNARVLQLAKQLTGPEFPAGDRAEREQLEHLMEQVVGWLGWEVFHADPQRPFFHRHNDMLNQWGGPNADNVYRHARIDPQHRYRISGKMHSCDQFLLAIRKGFMHNEVWGTVATASASDLGFGPGDDVEIYLGGQPIAGKAHVELPAGAIMASIREYYYDWTADEPATLIIECLDDDVVAGTTPTADDLVERLDRAFMQIEDSMLYWTRYLTENRDERTPNQFAEGIRVAKGLAVARYSFNFWDLAEDEALYIESAVPDADYWALQLYRMGTFELVDPWGRTTSRNHRQTVLSDDGRLRAVLSPVDVGAANWLDTGGRQTGLCTFRWFWPNSDTDPAPEATVVKVDQLRSFLPANTPMVSPGERQAELAARRSHLAWRFRV